MFLIKCHKGMEPPICGIEKCLKELLMETHFLEDVAINMFKHFFQFVQETSFFILSKSFIIRFWTTQMEAGKRKLFSFSFSNPCPIKHSNLIDVCSANKPSHFHINYTALIKRCVSILWATQKTLLLHIPN